MRLRSSPRREVFLVVIIDTGIVPGADHTDDIHAAGGGGLEGMKLFARQKDHIARLHARLAVLGPHAAFSREHQDGFLVEVAVRGGSVKVRPSAAPKRPVILRVEVSGEVRGGNAVARPPRRYDEARMSYLIAYSIIAWILRVTMVPVVLSRQFAPGAAGAQREPPGLACRT